jgi:hypothetical protein
VSSWIVPPPTVPLPQIAMRRAGLSCMISHR